LENNMTYPEKLALAISVIGCILVGLMYYFAKKDEERNGPG